MVSRSDMTLPIPRRARKSVGATTPRKDGEKENATVDVGTTSLAANRKKSRSKSMGPGGLDALKSTSGNRRVSLAAPSKQLPRSILKPTPLSEILPTRKQGKADPVNRNNGPSRPGPSNADGSSQRNGGPSSDYGSSGSKIAVRSEEEQQAAAREREERERRDARRKSLANRRVSFAAEATLHTFHDIEYMQDSTTSTDSTRRRSSLAAHSKDGPNTDLPSVPQITVDEETELPGDQTETRRQNRRRSSGISQASSAINETLMSMYSSDSEPADVVEEIVAEEDSNSSTDSDGDDGTMMTVEDDMSVEMSMDITKAVGGIIATHAGKDTSPNSADDEVDQTMEMELTAAVGAIHHPAQADGLKDDDDYDDDNDDNEEMSMELMTEVRGVIFTTNPLVANFAVPDNAKTEPGEVPVATPPMEGNAESSPINFGLRRASTPTRPATSLPPQSKSPARTAAKSPAKSPVLRGTGSPTRSPVRTPTARQSRRYSENIIVAETPRSPLRSAAKSTSRPSIFQQHPKTGNSTPSIVLTPRKRALSGVGVDRPGLGSPKIAAILDRRSSLGDATTDFVAGQKQKPDYRVIQFQSPQDVRVEGNLEEDREPQNGANEDDCEIDEHGRDGSSDDKETTLNLRDMIDRMSPKKNPLRGRKSLHVGSAKGILGKRPTELDDEDEEQDGIKRLRGHQGSPVKSIKLQQPPTKEETTGQLARHLRQSTDRASLTTPLTPTASATHVKYRSAITTPKTHDQSQDVKAEGGTVSGTPYGDTVTDVLIQGEIPEEERIHLQDFLNMISVRFMELNTTKRRHTTAPSALSSGGATSDADDMSLERCVVAGACTVPMLELYQHSCRELKKYISEGRRMVREIESETLELNPPLFREYVSATPEIKALMDNQFKNVKVHARLLSKAMWYEWRMKLQDGLKEGLTKIAEGMESDDMILRQQEQIIEANMPGLLKQVDGLRSEQESLESYAQELADSDGVELEAARLELLALDDDLQDKSRLTTQLRLEIDEMDSVTQAHIELKQVYLDEIKEAEKVREECRGWTAGEVGALKARVDEIERNHGWAISRIDGSGMSMTYRREIELCFDYAKFQRDQPNSSFDIRYIGNSRENDVRACTVAKEYFLHCIRDQARDLPQSRTRIADLLKWVRVGWDHASDISTSLGRVSLTYPTTAKETSESCMIISVAMLLVPLETKIEIVLRLRVAEDVRVEPTARVVYGEHFNVAKIGEYLSSRMGKAGNGVGHWSDVLVELQGRLIARGSK